MSDMVGADLEQLDQLADAFTKAGTEISVDAANLRGRVESAVGSFDETLQRLLSKASGLVGEMNTEMSSLSVEAAGITWTGGNREAFTSDVNTFGTAVTSGGEQIETDIGAIIRQVSTGFTPVLQEFGLSLVASTDAVEASSVTMKTAVANQRSSLDQAANVGWGSA